MGQEIYYHEYALKSRKALNVLSERREHRGVLLRIGDGFGCVHPWPELGDAELGDQLEALRRAEPTPLIARAYRCAGLDGLARREGRSLFAGLEIPESHALVSDVEGMLAAVEKGFTIVKLKCGADLEGERERLLHAAGEGLRVRLDFNEALGEDSFRDWWGALGEQERGCVDFVEDPFPYSAEDWGRVAREDGLRFAVDREAGRASGGYAIAVVKPAIDDVEAILGREAGSSAGIVFTTYLDHPVGSMYAAYEAAVARRELGERVLSCGLLTHRVLENDSFLERVVSEGPRLAAPEGTGLGFDELLEGIPWKLLK